MPSIRWWCQYASSVLTLSWNSRPCTQCSTCLLHVMSSSHLRMSSSTRMFGLTMWICPSPISPSPFLFSHTYPIHQHILWILPSKEICIWPFLSISLGPLFSSLWTHGLLQWCLQRLTSIFPTSHSQHSIQKNHLKHELVHNISLNKILQWLPISLRVKLKSKNVWQGPTTFCLSLYSSLATVYSHT